MSLENIRHLFGLFMLLGFLVLAQHVLPLHLGHHVNSLLHQFNVLLQTVMKSFQIALLYTQHTFLSTTAYTPPGNGKCPSRRRFFSMHRWVRSLNDLLCVGWDVKTYSLTDSAYYDYDYYYYNRTKSTLLTNKKQIA